MRDHGLADGGDDVAAQDDVLLDRRVSQVEVAVLEPLLLVRLTAAVDLKRQLVVDALAEDLDLLGDDLDLAGGELRVFAGALAHGAGDGDGGFLVERLDHIHHVLGLHDDLRRAVEVAQDDKGKVAADDADVFHPAAERDVLARVFQTQCAAGMGSGLHHKKVPSFFVG